MPVRTFASRFVLASVAPAGRAYVVDVRSWDGALAVRLVVRGQGVANWIGRHVARATGVLAAAQVLAAVTR